MVGTAALEVVTAGDDGASLYDWRDIGNLSPSDIGSKRMGRGGKVVRLMGFLNGGFTGVDNRQNVFHETK